MADDKKAEAAPFPPRKPKYGPDPALVKALEKVKVGGGKR